MSIEVQRPERWSVPFSAGMTEDDVDYVLTIPPFNELDPSKFLGKVTLRGIVQNDSRIMRYLPGDIIVRRGDWGNSIFFVISGSVRVDLELPGQGLSEEMLGRQEPKRKGLFQAIAQLWNRPKYPEVRDPSSYHANPQLAARDFRKQIYLQDLSVVLDRCRTATISAGQFFGELSAMGRTPRTATVFADSDTELLEVRWQGLRDLMRRDARLQAHIDRVFRERALPAFMTNTHLFPELNNEEMAELVKGADFEMHGKYDWAVPFKKLVKQGEATGMEHEPIIAEEGHYPNGVIVIRSGLARLSQRFHHGQRTLGYLMGGHVFGLEEIEEGWRTGKSVPLKHTLRAIGNTGVITLPTSLIEKLVLKKKSPGRSARVPLQTAVDTSRINPEFVEFLVENRFVNGTATMVIDLDRCTRCDDCVRGCAGTHDNNPRFLRHGPIHGHFMIAQACMHCIDPVCMIECPTGAIHRDQHEGNVVINDQTCIGCKACANNCPYNAIRMVEVSNHQGEYIRDKTLHLPIVKATKCDLCGDQMGGPACQRACPHDALIRLDMRDVDALARWQNR